MNTTLKLQAFNFEIARMKFSYSGRSIGYSPKVTSYLLTE
jgi:hypothetical protein